jgi:hypothetical protein
MQSFETVLTIFQPNNTRLASSQYSLSLSTPYKLWNFQY